MTVFVILFRGVGGATQLPVKPLRAALEESGFEAVRTYINSGNAVLRSALSRAAVEARVTAVCAAAFGFTKAVFALSAEDWRALIAANPFPQAGGALLHAAVLAAEPEPARVAALKEIAAAEGSGFAILGRVAYLLTPEGFSRSKLAERFDRTIGAPNTARNWNTVLKLGDLAAAAEQEPNSRPAP